MAKNQINFTKMSKEATAQLKYQKDQKGMKSFLCYIQLMALPIKMGHSHVEEAKDLNHKNLPCLPIMNVINVYCNGNGQLPMEISTHAVI